MYPLQSSFLAREQHEVQSSAVLKSVLWSLRHIGSKARETLCHEEQLDEWDNTRHAIDWFHLTAPTRGTSHNSKPHARMQYGAEAALIAMGANDPRPAELTTLKYPPGGKMELWGYMTQDMNPHLITINGIVNSTLKFIGWSISLVDPASGMSSTFFTIVLMGAWPTHSSFHIHSCSMFKQEFNCIFIPVIWLVVDKWNPGFWLVEIFVLPFQTCNV